MVAVQASLVAAGSLEPDVVRQLVRRPGVARRYLAVEGHRALALNGTFLPQSCRGIVDNDVAGLATEVAQSLAVARGRLVLDDPPMAFGEIRPRQVLAAADRTERSTSMGAAGHDARSAVGPEPEEYDDADPRHLGHLLSSPVGGGGVLGRLLRRMFDATRTPGGDGPPGAGTRAHTGRPRSGRGIGVTREAPSASLDAIASLQPRAATYPEWDTHRHRYRPDWCTVHERAPDEFAPIVLPDGLALRRPLARLGTAFERVHRQRQGDEIDIDAAVEARVEALAGSPPEEAVYIESRRHRRDLAVLLLLDVSGSAGEPGPFGRTVHEHQRDAAIALTTALHDLGDRVALYAFNSQGRRAVHVVRLKGFDDRLDRRVVGRLGGLVPAAYTRLGAAIRHGAAVLETRGGTSRRLLVVLSDGFAYDHGYEGTYGEADARRALAEARRRGLGCLCLSIGAATDPAALRRVFGPAAHATVPSPDLLPGLVGPLFHAALRRVS